MGAAAVIFILGAGPGIGMGVARKFASRGFRVAVASRSVADGFVSSEGYLQVKVDLSQPASLPKAFESVKTHFGQPPSVIAYNGAFRITNPPDDPFSVPLDGIKTSITVSFESQYIAAQEALKGFAELPASMPKTFIFTGNTLNQIPIPQVFPFALSKRLGSTLIEYGANAYGPKGYRFYYADERVSSDGRPAGMNVDGEAHGEMYWQLAQPGKQENWLVTFTKDRGRQTYGGVDFDGTPYLPKS